MDQEKIGKFIAIERKRLGLTQAALAEELGITDRAVSKWETGRSLPDASIMLPLCKRLEISVNELLSGERLNDEQYRMMAESRLLELRQQEEAFNRSFLSLEWVIGVGSSAVLFLSLFSAVYAVHSPLWKAVLISIGLLVFLAGVGVCLTIEQRSGYYECPVCGVRYMPGRTAVFLAPHFGRTRLLRCPRCGERHCQKKVLTKN